MPTPTLLSYTSDGGICVGIDTKHYTYVIAKDRVEYVVGVFRYNPWQAVNWLKVNFKYYRKES